MKKREIMQEILTTLEAFKIVHDRYLSMFEPSARELKKNAPIMILSMHYIHHDGLFMAKLIVQAFGLRYQDPQRAGFSWLDHAALFGNQELVEWLLAEAREQNFVMRDFVNICTINGDTALDEAELIENEPYISMAQLLRSNRGGSGRDLPAVVPAI